jgi:hypothetical protein
MRVVKNRYSVALLGLLGICGVSVALADPPASPSTTAPAATPASAATSTPVAGANAAASAAKPATNAAADAAAAAAAEEKNLMAAGYKPEMRNGTKVWCRHEGELGSRLGGQKVCGTPQELKLVVQQNRELVEKMQKTQHNPGGN